MEWRVFFIGPMGKEKLGKGVAKAVDYRMHLPRLHKYLVTYLKKEHEYIETNDQEHVSSEGRRFPSVTLSNGKDTITVLTPFNLYGRRKIPDKVFDAIDESDLVIADLSGNKPAVIYELAFVHALGIETILVGNPESISFYLNQTNVISINFKAKKIVSDEFEGEIDNWLESKNKLFNSSNPLSDFYKAPLPDISAANGLAAGFYDNFAGPILMSGKIVDRKQTSKGKTIDKVSPLKGLIVLRPENLTSSVMELKAHLEEQLTQQFPGEVQYGELEKLFISTEEGVRTPFFLVRNYLIDIPRTMFSLRLSPRLERYSGSPTLKNNMESVLIGRFFEGVKKYIGREEAAMKNKKKLFHFGSVEEIPEIIKTGESKTWS